MNGIIIIKKEKGYTSHDVVAKLRGILHTKKIGHTGTLDPDAVGVLPVCIGKATKVCDLLTDKEKTYLAEVKLGITTDTLDMTGKTLTEKKVTVTPEEIERCLSSFRGEIQQIPPMYSAIKVNGKKLYELARQGKEIKRKPRKVTIYELLLRDMALANNEFTIEVTCSKGTYIRSLCQDIGEKLGCGAAMKSLVRTRVGRFTLEKARTLGEMEALAKDGEVETVLIPIDQVFDMYRRCDVQEPAMKFLRNGNLVKPEFCRLKDIEDGEQVRIYGTEGEFYAIYRYEATDNMLHIVKMFHIEE